MALLSANSRWVHNQTLYITSGCTDLLEKLDKKFSAFSGTGSLITANQNLIPERIKRRLNSVNACYNSVQSLL
jgi:hypothetical protein